MRSIITFSDCCTLKNIQVKSRGVHVINCHEVFSVVSAICSRIPDSLLTEQQISDLYNKLYPYTQVDAVVKTQHNADIHHNLHSHFESSAYRLSASETPKKKSVQQSLICPVCGGNLILRTAMHGAYAGKQFYGCSNYPKCRFIQDLSAEISRK